MSSLRRHPRSPILTRADIPDVPPRLADATSVFNPGAVRFGDRIVLLLRVQARSRETFLMAADAPDGLNFRVRPEILELRGIEKVRERIYHVYDPRVTRIDGTHYVMVALDMDDGCRLGLARSEDLSSFEFLGLAANEDIRNGVLFPEKIGGRYLRFDRPNSTRLAGGPTSGGTIWLSESDDLLAWTPVAPVASGRFHYWDELIGSGPPPVKTRAGWLHVYHGVATHFGSANIYQAGVMLHDLSDPSKVIGRSRHNILEPRRLWEMSGQVPNVVFPSGMIVEGTDDDGFAPPEAIVRIYYGAADTAVGLAETTIGELILATGEPPLP
jgi:beta-1,4-mannooligosaccharide/beta-1,4-mannosyl-N-acetylglucosamine phosphorylase